MGTGIEDGLRAINRSDAAADAAGKPSADLRDHRGVVALPLGGVEIDQLHARESGELRDPHFGVGCLDRELLTLHELNDAPALEID